MKVDDIKSEIIKELQYTLYEFDQIPAGEIDSSGSQLIIAYSFKYADGADDAARCLHVPRHFCLKACLILCVYKPVAPSVIRALSR